jgi:hypothetical protein
MENIQLLTNSNDIAVFLVQFRIVEMLFSTKIKVCKVKKERSRIFSQRVPRRDSVDKDGGDKSRPEQTEHIHSC